MKKILSLVFLTLITPTSLTYADELISIKDYLKTNNFNDPVVKLNTYDQCSGLILMLVGEERRKPLPEKFKPLMQNGYVDVTKATIYLIKHSFKDPVATEAQEEINMDKMVKQYKKYVYDLEKNTKNKFEDPLIDSDLKSCIKIIKEAKK